MAFFFCDLIQKEKLKSQISTSFFEFFVIDDLYHFIKIVYYGSFVVCQIKVYIIFNSLSHVLSNLFELIYRTVSDYYNMVVHKYLFQIIFFVYTVKKKIVFRQQFVVK